MKNRKSLLTLGILALVLVLGVGYAAVTSVGLTINGEASVEEADLQVYFTAVDTKGEGSTGDAVVTASVTDPVITTSFKVEELELTDTVVLEYTIENQESDVDATLTDPTVVVENDEYYSATAKLDTTSLPVDGTATLTVAVTLLKTPVEDTDSSSTITITLNAEPVNN